MLIPKSSMMLPPKCLQPSKQILLLFISTLLGLTAAFSLLLQSASLSQAAAPMTDPVKPTSASGLTNLQPQAQITPSNPITSLDIVLVFDISGSMEDQTICHDCWVRTTYNISSSPYPGNGYFNPIPYDPGLAPGAPNQSIPASRLCTDPPTPWLQSNGGTTYQYLTLESELYSANVGDWSLDARTPGQGFWAIQRGSRGSAFPPGVDAADEDSEQQGNQAGKPDYQSSNVCNPALPGGINCKITWPGNVVDDICVDEGNNGPGPTDVVRDCSAYLSARPFETYSQRPGNIPTLNGASYNLDCFVAGPGPFNPDPFALDGVYSNRCWTNDRTAIGQDGYNPFYDPVNGPLTEPGPSNVPWVEYDFTPTWTDTDTYIWIRAIGGGEQAYTYAGPSPDNLSPDLNGGGTGNNLSGWRKVIFWQIGNGEVFLQNDNNNSAVQFWNTSRDTRADSAQWRWVKLGSTLTVSGTQYTLKLYQGSPGYKVDKIVFTNDPNGSTGSPPPAMRRQLNGAIAASDGREAFGPPASYGSATREACNLCNPIYGKTVNQAQCSCLKNNTEARSRYVLTDPNYNPVLYGTGTGCSLVLQPTSMLTNVITITVTPPEVQPPQIQTRTVVNDLYSGLQPLRSAQEAVKNLALGKGVEEQYQLKPGFDQVGFVAFTADTGGYARPKLQCLRTKNPPPTDAATCYAEVLAAVERQWPNWGTNIAEGMREGLEELGISVGSNIVGSGCTASVNDGQACDRGGAAKRVLILMTDGVPNTSPTSGSLNCTSQPGYADYWEGLIGNGDVDFECAMWYAQQAAAKGVIVYTIGIGTAANADFLTTMATGADPRNGTIPTPVPMFNAQCGQYFPVAKPSDLDSALFETILEQARNCAINVPVLSLTKSDTSEPVSLGEVLTYTLTVTNYGAISATDAIITDALDSNVSFATASDGGVYDAGIVTWNVGVIPPYQILTRTLAVTVGNLVSGGVLTNTAWLTSSEGVRHSSTATTDVIGMLIWSVSGYTVLQNSNLIVHLENHLSQGGPYDIYLSDGTNSFKICSGVNTTPATNNGDFDCFIEAGIPPGMYDLFSTRENQYPNRLATAPQQVRVMIGTAPAIVIGGGNIWAANSSITLTLVAHQPADEPFQLYFDYGGAYSQTIAANVLATPDPIVWKVPSVGSLCPIGGVACTIESRRVSTPTQQYAYTNLHINQPEIVVPSGNGPYAGGETIFIYLKGHTPGRQYDLKISGPTGPTYLGRTGLTNAVGDSLGPLAWVLPVTWPNGLYDLSSHPTADPLDLSDDTRIAILADIEIKTPTVYLPLILK